MAPTEDDLMVVFAEKMKLLGVKDTEGGWELWNM
jgi:hypothetical protein